MFPAAALLATVAPVIIVPLLGTKWEHYRSMFIVLTLLAVYAGNRTMLSVFFEAYKSIGKPWIVPIYNGIKLAAMIPAMAIGAQFGIVGLAFVYIPVQIIEFPAALILADRVLDVSPLQVWGASRVPLISTFTMTAATLAVELLMTRGGHVGNTATLGVCLVVAGCTYLGSLYVLDRSIVSEGRAILTRGL
jgi:hypothetical protein